MATNWSGNVNLNAQEYRPRTPEELKGTLEKLFERGKKARGLGGRYSTSHVMAPAAGGETICTTELLLDRAKNERNVRKVAPFASRGPAKWFRRSTAGLVAISAGATVDEVNRYLEVQRRSLRMMGAFSGQTFVGAMLTGTHGTSGALGPLADLVVSLDVVTIDSGRVVRYRIERSAGPTHADNYEADTGNKVFHSDDLFNAFVVSFGYLGIVTSVGVETVPLFNLKHQNECISWNEVKSRLSAHTGDGIPTVLKNTYGLGVTMCPYPRADGVFPTCVWNEVRRTTGKPTPNNTRPAMVSAGTLLPIIFGAPAANIPAAIDSTLQAEVKPGFRIDIAHRILTSPSGFPIKGFGIEFAFPVGPDLAYLTSIKQLLEEVVALEKARPARRLAGFFTLRFVRSTRAYLGQSHGPEGGVFCTVEVLGAAKRGDPDVVFPRLVDVALAAGGRTHFGQIFDVKGNLKTISQANIAQALGNHPGFRRWKTHYARFNSTGTFDNQVGDLFP